MKFKHITKTFLFIIVFFILQFFIGKLLRADYNSFARIMMKELHSDINIDVLFLGDSHIYRAINPKEYKKTTGLDCFIAAFPGQEIDATYAILQEALYYHPEIKHIFFDIDPEQLCIDDFKNRTKLKHVYACSNYLKNKKIKREFLLNANSPYYYLNSTLEIGKNKINPKPKLVLNTLKAHLNGNFKNDTYPTLKDESFEGRGFVLSYKTNTNFFSDNTDRISFTPDSVSKDFVLTFDKIYNYCVANNLKLTLLSVPESPYKIFSYTNYDTLHNYIFDLCNLYNLNYLDFNFIKTEYLTLTSDDFYDAEHVNSYGAEKITNVFNELITSNFSRKYFYNDLNQKMDLNDDDIFGINILKNDDNKSFRIIPIGILTKESNITYNIHFENKKDSSKNIDFITSENEIKFPEHDSGKITVTCFLNDELKGSIDTTFNTRWIK